MRIGKIRDIMLEPESWISFYFIHPQVEIHAQMIDNDQIYYLCKKQCYSDKGYNASSSYMNSNQQFQVYTELPVVHYKANYTDFVWLSQHQVTTWINKKNAPNKEKSVILQVFREEEF